MVSPPGPRSNSAQLMVSLFSRRFSRDTTNIVLYEPHHEKTGFCLCKNKGADQLYSNWSLCFCYTDSTIPLLPKSEI